MQDGKKGTGCPFCGGNAHMMSCHANGATKIVVGTYVCIQCKAKITLETAYEVSPIDAMKAVWERRHGDV